MDALTCIATRRTAPAIHGPEPTSEQLTTILRAATYAPDHKLLRPWRFILIRGEARHSLGKALVAAAEAADPQVSDEMRTKLRQKSLRAPLLIAIIACPAEGAKLPVWEQHASVAAAAQNICLAAHALGLASAWKSSHLGDAPPVRALFAMQAKDNCFGWIEVGTPSLDVKPKARPPVDLGVVVSELNNDRLHPYDSSAKV